MSDTDDVVWRVVPGFDGWYDVSSLGDVRSWRTRAKLCHRSPEPRTLPTKNDAKGYRKVKLTHPVLGKVMISVHHLVLAAFVGPRPHGLVCDHINANRSDNRVANLRWVTTAENIAHAADLGRMNVRPGARAQSPLTEADITAIRRRRQAGETLRKLASAFGVVPATISRIALGQTWKDVAS
jgi:hypothetical protein